jgi:hypothetical protein
MASNNLKSISTGLVVLVISALPWLIVIAPVGLVGWLSVKLIFRRYFTRTKPVVSV